MESQVNALSRHLPANLLSGTQTVASSSDNLEAGRKESDDGNASAATLDRVLRCLVQLPVSSTVRIVIQI